MGLLDNFANAPAESGFNDALLAAAQALLTPRARGGGMGAAFGAFPAAMNQAQAREMRNRMFGLQEREFEANAAEAERKRAEAARQQAQVESFIQTLPPEQQRMARLDPQAFVKTMTESKVVAPGGAIVQGGKEVYKAPFKPEAQPELTRLLMQRDSLPEGHPYRSIYDQQISKLTTHQPGTTVNVSTGQKDSMWGEPPKNYVWARDPRTGEVMTQADKTGAAAPVAVPIAGSKEATERSESDRKLGQRQQYAQNIAGIVLSTVKDAKEKVGPLTAGLGGSIMGVVPGSSAVDLRALVDTVKANIGFQRLQEMREMSPTGGALGQVAVQELNMLQSVISSLDVNQSPTQLRQSLEKIERHFNNWKKAVDESAWQAGQPAAATETPKRMRFNPATGKLE